ncbi:L-aspartate oxidase [Arthrobacter sp. PvP023]|uniref:L-aspartate oxidase n=1 Tax=Micrococcaceae TaxID=1268 RepID=UPI001AE38E5A|nr:FAD-binding protein [Arthrobacter sp. PvP023]MBP1135783.1 L-aspartate oxidase [Arthrobacter sp. PvP023]
MTTARAARKGALEDAPQRRRLVVVGSGIAGLYAALLAADAEGGTAADVVLLSKGQLEHSNTFYAQGGVSAVLEPGEAAPGDTVDAHVADTLAAGAGLNNLEAVRILCTEAVRDIAGLRRYGVLFDADAQGDTALGLEAAHSAPRILHAGGDATGARIARGLIAAVLERAVSGRLRLETGAFVTELTTTDGRVTGVNYLQAGELKSLPAAGVLLATGGAGRIFARTSNPLVATADGLALAWRAGAVVGDLEFFQFHPTTMAMPEAAGGPPPLLVSEAVRGEGAVLLDADGHRFMPDYHPDAELAPRDVVSRSIALHLARTGAPADSPVFLDARGIEAARGSGFLARRFPTISAATAAAGFDWTAEPLPVSPAAHYWMGGVVTDVDGRTTVPGLYAAGEVACTGAQGANRLASNSLLEGLVFGRRAVESFLDGEPGWVSTAGVPLRAVSAAGGLTLTHASGTPAVDDSHLTFAYGESSPAEAPEGVVGTATDPGPFSRDALGRLMTGAAGVLRTGAELDATAAQLALWQASISSTEARDPREHEDRNLLLAARLLVEAARKRTVSLGAHHRADTDHAPAPTHSMQRISS